ncbi:MAG: type 1 glutamine amidotransferase [Nocardioidaceae bacterium]
MHVTIGWLYGTTMNIYGDRGNVLALTQRARWRGIEPRIRQIGVGEPVPDDIDVFFVGGGQDQGQVAVAADLQGQKGDRVKAAVEEGSALLAICGGYQLLGHEYLPHGAAPLPGIGLFDVTTSAGPKRLIGNVIIDSRWGALVGFENHSGLTYLGDGTDSLGMVRVGFGNNGRDSTGGALYRHAIGCYLHGAFLPKNPIVADWLLEAGIGRREPGFVLSTLDDELELQAHNSAFGRA